MVVPTELSVVARGAGTRPAGTHEHFIDTLKVRVHANFIVVFVAQDLVHDIRRDMGLVFYHSQSQARDEHRLDKKHRCHTPKERT